MSDSFLWVYLGFDEVLEIDIVIWLYFVSVIVINIIINYILVIIFCLRLL